MGISTDISGFRGIAGLSLMLPFMFGLDPVYGLALMIGLVAVVPIRYLRVSIDNHLPPGNCA